jgi:hypothetical protein
MWSVNISSVYFSWALLSLIGAFHSFNLLVLLMQFLKPGFGPYICNHANKLLCESKHQASWFHRRIILIAENSFRVAWLKCIMFYAHALKESNQCGLHSVNVLKHSLYLILFKNSISDSPKHAASPLRAGNVAWGNNYSGKYKKRAHTVCEQRAEFL